MTLKNLIQRVKSKRRGVEVIEGVEPITERNEVKGKERREVPKEQEERTAVPAKPIIVLPILLDDPCYPTPQYGPRQTTSTHDTTLPILPIYDLPAKNRLKQRRQSIVSVLYGVERPPKSTSSISVD